ncbi:MAG: polysaccharide pyruvyl transferase CsaB [bacterium]|nr:polysaccharide pyruvyl transferase CsaB [bacterium]
MKRLLLIGYFGFDNLGDELLLISLLDYLRRNLPDIEPIVFYGKPLSEVYGAKVIPRSSLINAIRMADGICFAGGSILQDVTSIRSLLYYLGIILLSSTMKKPVIMISQGIGPIGTVLGRKLLRILNLVYSISVRDRDSLSILEEFGICKPRYYLGKDLVLYLDLEKFRKTLTEKKRDVLISVREFPNFKKDDFLKAIVRFKNRYNLDVAILVTHKLEDRSISERFARELNCSLILWEDPYSVFSTMSSFKFIVSMRLHPLILSALLDIPFLGITYDPKVKSFISHFPNAYSLDIKSNLNDIENILSLSWENRDTVISDILKFKDGILDKEETFRPLYELYDVWFKDR